MQNDTFTISIDQYVIFMETAEKHFDKKNFEKAISCFKKAIENDADKAEAYIGLGEVYEEIGDFSKAIEVYKQVLKFVPEDVDGYINLAFIYEEKGDDKLAVSYYKKALEINGEDVNLLMNLADNLDSQLKEEALEYYSLAFDIEASNVDLSINYAYSLIRFNKLDLAVQLLNKVIDTSSKSSALMNLGHIALIKGDISTCMDYYKQSLVEIDDEDLFYSYIKGDSVLFKNHDISLEYFQEITSQISK